jgi:hypothetical protein
MHRMESAGLTAGVSRRVSMCIRLVSPSGFGLLFQGNWCDFFCVGYCFTFELFLTGGFPFCISFEIFQGDSRGVFVSGFCFTFLPFFLTGAFRFTLVSTYFKMIDVVFLCRVLFYLFTFLPFF